MIELAAYRIVFTITAHCEWAVAHIATPSTLFVLVHHFADLLRHLPPRRLHVSIIAGAAEGRRRGFYLRR